VTVRTAYPWDGDLDVEVRGSGQLSIRVPSWATGAKADVDGAEITATPGEYLTVQVGDGAKVRLSLPMDVRLVRADERVDAVRGCVAIARGPLFFCVEQADLPDGILVEQIRLDPTAPITAEHSTDDLTPVRLHLSGVVRENHPDLYAPLEAPPAGDKPVSFTAIPYHSWANRGPGAMRVWLPLT
jgi:DUF1680 family protein